MEVNISKTGVKYAAVATGAATILLMLITFAPDLMLALCGIVAILFVAGGFMSVFYTIGSEIEEEREREERYRKDAEKWAAQRRKEQEEIDAQRRAMAMTQGKAAS